MMLFRCFLVAALGMQLLACDMKKKLDKMAETTNQMGSSTTNIEDSSEKLEERTESLYTGMREAESIQIMRDSFNLVIRESGVTAKANASLTYFGAMEFQHWYPTSKENTDTRDRLYLKAVELFFSRIDDLVEDSYPIQNDSLFNNDWIALSVIAVGMSKVHPEQIHRSNEMGFEPVSFYDVLKKGLAAKSQALMGEPIAEYQTKILQNERTVRYLLQLRHNFFKALLVARLSDFEEGLWEKLMIRIFGWSVDMDTIPEAEVSLLNEWLWKSLETQIYIQTLGDEVLVNDTFDGVLAGATLSMTGIPSPSRGLYDNGALIPLERVHTETSVRGLFVELLQQVMGPSTPRFDYR